MANTPAPPRPASKLYIGINRLIDEWIQCQTPCILVQQDLVTAGLGGGFPGLELVFWGQGMMLICGIFLANGMLSVLYIEK